MNITIRHAEPDDYRAIQAIHAGPKAIRGTLQIPFPPAERWRKRLAEAQEGGYFLVACAGEEVIGSIHLGTRSHSPRRRHVGRLGMAVRDDWQGQGVGSAMMAAVIDLADNWLNLTRLELEVFCDNEAAIRLYQKFGFEIEGTMRNFAFREGAYADVYTMARLREGG